MRLEIFRPLEDDVIGENNSEETKANEGGKDNEVRVTISRWMVFSVWKEWTRKDTYFSPF